MNPVAPVTKTRMLNFLLRSCSDFVPRASSLASVSDGNVNVAAWRFARRCCTDEVPGIMSGGLSHRRPKTIVDQVPPASIRAAARDIACRAFDVHVLAVGTCAIN